MLNKYKDWRVSTLTVRRDPIGPALNHVLNLVSLGSWNKARSQFGFDTLFHLGLVMGLTSPDGKEHTEVLAEKNEVIKVTHPKALLPTSQILRVSAPVPPVTLEAFLETARRAVGNGKFFLYDAFKNNCQDFVQNLLHANRALDGTALQFIKQDISQLIAAQPGHLNGAANAVTDVGARADRIIHGGRVLGKRPRSAHSHVQRF